MAGFIGLHVGAGQHSELLLETYKKLCHKACKKGIVMLKNGSNALEVVTEVTAVLENSPLTNAGYGSTLTWDGEVECDASVMDGNTLLYGAVGAVSGVKNPVKLAQNLCCKQSGPTLALGRIAPRLKTDLLLSRIADYHGAALKRMKAVHLHVDILAAITDHLSYLSIHLDKYFPENLSQFERIQNHFSYNDIEDLSSSEEEELIKLLEGSHRKNVVIQGSPEVKKVVYTIQVVIQVFFLLVGDGAHKWAKAAGIPIVPKNTLISGGAMKKHLKYKKRLERFHSTNSQVMSPLETVGVVCVDGEKHVASACSSGGIALKHSGRVGQAAVYGCGCWAMDPHNSLPGIATCTSGCGEYLIRTSLAREVAEGIQTCETDMCVRKLHDTMTSHFINSPFLKNVEVNDKLGGVIVLKYTPDENCGEFLWAHTTKTMMIGYARLRDTKPKTYLSSLPANKQMGNVVNVEGITFRF